MQEAMAFTPLNPSYPSQKRQNIAHLRWKISKNDENHEHSSMFPTFFHMFSNMLMGLSHIFTTVPRLSHLRLQKPHRRGAVRLHHTLRLRQVGPQSVRSVRRLEKIGKEILT